jgi:hypothetical protein
MEYSHGGRIIGYPWLIVKKEFASHNKNGEFTIHIVLEKPP